MQLIPSYKEIYTNTCRDSDPQDLDSTIKTFENSPEGEILDTARGLFFNIDSYIYRLGASAITPIPPRLAVLKATSALADTYFESWLKNGNCPPPRAPQTAESGAGTIAAAGSSSDITDASLDGKNGLLLLGTAAGLGALAGVCYLASAFLVADDTTGVGLVDDPALLITLPVATASAAIAADAATKLAAGILLHLQTKSPEEPQNQLL